MNKINLLLLICLLVVTPLFFIGGLDFYSGRSLKFIWNFGHIIFFAVATCLALRAMPSFAARTFWFQCIAVICISFVAGLAIELFQYWTSRKPDVEDLVKNMLGALIAVVMFSPSTDTVNKHGLLAARVVLAMIVCFQGYWLSSILYDEWNMRQQFPLLADFESFTEVGRWEGDIPFYRSDEQQASGDYSLKIELDTSRYSGIDMNYLVSDWQGYDSLTLAVNNPHSEPLPVTIRIHDKHHAGNGRLYRDRFNRGFLLQRGWNGLSIDLHDIAGAPESRQMDMSAIVNVSIFVVDQKTVKTIFLDNIRLVKAAP